MRNLQFTKVFDNDPIGQHLLDHFAQLCSIMDQHAELLVLHHVGLIAVEASGDSIGGTGLPQH